jgi:hypothetical protein
MSRIQFSTLVVCVIAMLTSCALFDSGRPLPNRTYGKQSNATIAVTAKHGFRRPGLHHVAKGTTLRQFIGIAQPLPGRSWGEGEFFCGCRVQQLRNGKPTGFQSPGKPTDAQLDDTLTDGAIVSIIKWSL